MHASVVVKSQFARYLWPLHSQCHVTRAWISHDWISSFKCMDPIRHWRPTHDAVEATYLATVNVPVGIIMVD